MLSVHQATLVAYMGEYGELFHPHCLELDNESWLEWFHERAERTDTGYVGPTLEDYLEDQGYSPLIRYTLGEEQDHRADQDFDYLMQDPDELAERLKTLDLFELLEHVYDQGVSSGRLAERHNREAWRFRDELRDILLKEELLDDTVYCDQCEEAIE